MNKYIIIISICCCCMASCIKDEALNKECDIESAWIEGKAYEDYFYKTTEMRKEVSSAETDIVFSVRSLLSLSTQIPLNFKITDGATIEPANGSMQDFTKGPVVYTVTSEDGEWKRTYNVTFKEVPLPAEKYSFEHVEIDKGNPMLGSTNEMHVFYELTENNERNYCWATGNSGSALTKNGSKLEEFPVYLMPDGKEGAGVCLNTQSAGMMGEWMKKPIAAGCLFLGKFIIDYVLTDALKATQFGVPISKEPVRITGWYKYKRGEKFTDKDMNVFTDRKDEASIYAVSIATRTKKEQTTPLTVMLWKTLTSCLTTRRHTRLHAWLRCRPPTRGHSGRCSSKAETPPTTSSQPKGFNLALVFSSSFWAAQFEGAIGSTLYVDEVEISYEK